jgi:hypothetical protein
MRKTISDTLNAELNRPLPDTLYHYTTGTGMLGIVKSKTIWATNIHSMNDANEFKLALQITRSLLKEETDKDYTSAIELIASRLEGIEGISICTASFSEEPDELSQWRAYTGDYGFSIGFQTDILSIMAEEQGFFLAPCIYEYKKQITIIKEILNPYMEMLRYTDHLDSDNRSREQVNNFIKHLVIYGPMLKHETFKEEHEWRLISYPLRAGHEQMEYRSGKSMITPHFCFKLCHDNKPIKLHQIVVGPTPHSKQAMNSVTGLCIKYEIKYGSIGYTKTPYRNW